MSGGNNLDEISILIDEVRAGDQQAFAELLERYRPLLVSLVLKFESDDITKSLFEDLLQEATLVFYNAILTYDKTQTDVEFGLYARICVSNALVSQMRIINRRRAEHLNDFDIGDIAKNEIFEDLERDVVANENLRALYSIIRNNLSDYEYSIWHHYMLGKTAKEIGVMVGSSDKSVSNAIYRIRKKLRGLLK